MRRLSRAWRGVKQPTLLPVTQRLLWMPHQSRGKRGQPWTALDFPISMQSHALEVPNGLDVAWELIGSMRMQVMTGQKGYASQAL